MTGQPITGRQIRSAGLFHPKTLVYDGTPEECVRALSGARILAVSRRAKYIRITTDAPEILIHLRMSGSLRCEPDAGELRPHDRMAFSFEDGYRLVFNDVRKFGRVWVTADPDAVLSGLGIEPLGEDFTAEWLAEKLAGQRRAIKAILLDQGVIAGIGNIYADESLFDAGILPMRAGGSLTAAECARLRDSIRCTLLSAIEKGGSSFDWAYEGGRFQNEFRVYHRKGEPCFRCGTPIEKITLAQRGTHFCPCCQA